MRIARPAIALLTGMVLASCTSASASPSSSETSVSPAASESSAPSASAEPSVVATPEPTSTPVAAQLPVPGFVSINADALLVRQEPGLDGEPVVDMSNCIDNPNPCERPFTVGADRGYVWAYLLEGPIAADGYDWYLAATAFGTPEDASSYPDAVGWVAAGDGDDAWLVPDERSCPSEPIELSDVTNLALTKLEMLYCLGDQELTLPGWLPPVAPGEETPPSQLAECRAENRWFICWSIGDMIRPIEEGWAGSADYLDFAIDPDSDVVIPDRGQWVTINGRFDHPDAASCGDIAAVVICRFTFVLSAIQPEG